MPPTRTRDPVKAGEGSASADVESKSNEDASPKRWRRKKDPIPGVSKLKAAIRQTRRLLAKDKLAADVRIETERRLKSQEADLAKAQLAIKERSLAVRYHRIKFFDRQKLTRKIKQTKKQLAADGLSSKARKSVQSTLFELRVDVNYVLNYPKTEKYISLFPPEVRHTPGAEPVHSASSDEKTITDARREELRDRIRGRMQAGELSAEPETLHADGESRSSKKEAKETKGKGKTEEKGGEKGRHIRDDDESDGDDDEGEDESDEPENEDVDMEDVQGWESEPEREPEPEPEPEPVQVKVKGSKKHDPTSGQAKNKVTKPPKESSKAEKVAKPGKAVKAVKKVAKHERKTAKPEKKAAEPERKVSTVEIDDFFGSDSD